MTFGDTADAGTVEAVCGAALELGITGIDCANGYGRGRAEELISGFVRSHRDEIVLSTKAGIPHPDAQGAPPLSPGALRRSLTGSLRRLGVDTIDLFYLHQPDHDTPLQETVGELARMHADGLFRELGVSNFAAWQVADLGPLVAEAGLPPITMAQNVYNLLSRRIEHEWVDFAAAHQLRTLCYNPLAGGLLARPGASEQDLPTRFTQSALSEMYRKRYLTDTLTTAAIQLDRVAREAGMSLVEAALRWILGTGIEASILVGTDRVEHLRANVAALARGPLPPELQERLTAVTDPLRGLMNPYQR